MMNKNDILQRAQAQKHDEGRQYFRIKAKSIGALAFTLIALALMFCSAYHGRKITEILILYWAYLGTTCFAEFYYTRSKVELIVGIFLAVSLVWVAFPYMRNVLL